ncbi:pantetheine-phosphate adenylyltransferase [Spiroplasma diminutum]|uniref:Phosphopantetheine adenylyltransferase n=1 Tax=Spiroplasma diminutum CUAS-1 TaxID=1276221 RepID=S5M2Y7_9MOLU|nr:pantetheine-phosphate adenylyltransferase [Spiroplasma diminutum]AGR42442.1 phosphopantetheine adenylyltransferase [Spiroplasma diminutum CUAS-1]
MKRAIYPGSFDPFHEGHLNILLKASKLFDEVIIVITKNIAKNSNPDLKSRVDKIKLMTKDIKNVKIEINENQLTAEFAKNRDVQYVVRGIRDAQTLEYEIELNDGNKSLFKDLETVLFLSDNENRKISSSLLKEIEKYKNKEN